MVPQNDACVPLSSNQNPSSFPSSIALFFASNVNSRFISRDPWPSGKLTPDGDSEWKTPPGCPRTTHASLHRTIENEALFLHPQCNFLQETSF